MAFAAIYIVWGSTYLGMRVAIETMPPLLMAGARFITAGAILYLVLRWRGAAAPTVRHWRINTLIGTFLLLGGNGLVVWAEQWVPSGITALIIGVQPLFFVLTEWAWPGGSRPTLISMGALLLGFAGVAWLAMARPVGGATQLDGIGVAAILAACVFWAFGSITSRHMKNNVEPLLAASLQMLAGGLALTLAALARGEFSQFRFAAVSAPSWWAFAYLIAVGSLIGFSTFVWLIKHATPARVSTYAYVNPVVAVFLGWLILDEPVSARVLVASAVIITAVAVITVEKSRARKPQ